MKGKLDYTTIPDDLLEFLLEKRKQEYVKEAKRVIKENPKISSKEFAYRMFEYYEKYTDLLLIKNIKNNFKMDKIMMIDNDKSTETNFNYYMCFYDFETHNDILKPQYNCHIKELLYDINSGWEYRKVDNKNLYGGDGV